MTTTPAMPEPFAWAWRNKVTGAKGVYFEDPKPFGITSHPDYEWTNLYTEAQPRATLQAQPAEVSDAEIDAVTLEQWGPDAIRAAHRQYARAILALRPQAVPMTGGWQEVAACPDGDVWFSLSCGHVVMGWKQGPLLLDWEAAVDHDCCSDASAIKAMPVTPPAHHGITAPAGGEG